MAFYSLAKSINNERLAVPSQAESAQRAAGSTPRLRWPQETHVKGGEGRGQRPAWALLCWPYAHAKRWAVASGFLPQARPPKPCCPTCSAACARVGRGEASDLSVTPPDVEEFIELTALW